MAYHPYYPAARAEFSVPAIIQPLIPPAVNANAPNPQTVATNSYNYHFSNTANKAKSLNASFASPSYHGPPTMLAPSGFDTEPDRPRSPPASVKLENEDLWQDFYKHGTEMVITKAGR